MARVKLFFDEEIRPGFRNFNWKKPEGTEHVRDAAALRSEKTGFTLVKFKLDPNEMERVAETGEVFMVLCTPGIIPPFWVGGDPVDAFMLADKELT